eukprot:7928674-Pyramimonas_sp.AAC.1
MFDELNVLAPDEVKARQTCLLEQYLLTVSKASCFHLLHHWRTRLSYSIQKMYRGKQKGQRRESQSLQRHESEFTASGCVVLPQVETECKCMVDMIKSHVMPSCKASGVDDKGACEAGITLLESCLHQIHEAELADAAKMCRTLRLE